MDDQYTIVGPETTMAEIVQLAGFHLLNNGLDGFDFDVPGESDSGQKILLHFECTVKLV